MALQLGRASMILFEANIQAILSEVYQKFLPKVMQGKENPNNH